MDGEQKIKDVENPDFFIWQGSWQGGAEKVTLGVAEILKEEFNITPTLGVFDEDPSRSFPQIQVRRIFPQRLVAYNNIWASFWLRMKSLLNNFDIVFTHCEGLWKTDNNFHVYYEPEDFTSRFYRDSLRKRIIYSFPTKITKNTLRKSDLPICTDNSEEFFQKMGVEKYLKSNGFVDTGKFNPADKTGSRNGGKIDVLFVGRDDPRKNFDALKKACLDLSKNVDLRVVGFSKPNEGNIRYLGRVPEIKLIKEYQNADLFVLPSHYEGFGMSALEALACGTPVIFSKTACPRVLEEYVKLCEPSSESIKKSIESFLEDPKSEKRKFRNNVSKIRKNFGKESTLTELIEKIISRFERRK